MIKQVLGAAAVGLMTGVAIAQTYIPTSPPAGAVGVPGSTTTTTTTSPITKGVDANGNEITKKDSYREGVAGSSESHTTTATWHPHVRKNGRPPASGAIMARNRFMPLFEAGSLATHRVPRKSARATAAFVAATTMALQ
jgi:hypothetical protein